VQQEDRWRHPEGARRRPWPRLLAAAVVAAGLAALVPVTSAAAGVASINDFIMGAAPTAAVVVVDDDGAQCPQADVTSVQDALALVSDGGRVRVCPGRYRTPVTISRPVHIQGAVGAVSAFDCLDPAPRDSDDIDPTRFAILEPGPADATEETTPLRVESDDVEVSGLVVQGMTDETPERPAPTVPLYDAAIAVPDSVSRVRLHHNLVRDNTLGIEIGASGSRVDHNCLRDNLYAIANQRYHLVGARIDDNTTFRTTNRALEIGWSYAGTSDVLIEHNVSIDDPASAVYWIENAVRPRVEANEVHGSRFAVVLRLSTGARLWANEIRAGTAGVVATRNTDGDVIDNVVTTSGQGVSLGGGNSDVVVARNRVTGSTSGGAYGILLVSPAPAPVNRALTIEDNTVSGLHGTPGSGLVVNSGAVQPGSILRRNDVGGNPGDGIVLAPDIDGLLVEGNVASGNGGDGIRLETRASENVLKDNVSLGNDGVDARDLSVGAGATSVLNEWVRTTCATDVPVGAICVPPATAVSP
jgi:parallel beta-helix repeat protein